MNIMKILEGKKALGGSGTKDIGEYKVRKLCQLRLVTSVLTRRVFPICACDTIHFVLEHAQFWKTQPVPQSLSQSMAAQNSPGGSNPSASIEIEEGPIDPPKTIDEVKKESLALPGGYEWSVCDVTDEAVVSLIAAYSSKE